MPAPHNAQQQPAEADGKPRTTYEDIEPGWLAGNLTRDPELRFTPQGQAVASLRVAETTRIKDDDSGQWKDGPTTYHDVIAWGNLGTNAAEDLVKGNRIIAAGIWQRQKWQDDQGEQRSKVALVARDLGPSVLFTRARVQKTQKAGPR